MLIRNRNHEDWLGKEIEAYQTPPVPVTPTWPGWQNTVLMISALCWKELLPGKLPPVWLAARYGKSLLNQFDIRIGAYIKSLADI